MTRRYGAAIITALMLSFALAHTTQPARAFGSCWLSHRYEGYDGGYVSVLGGIDGVTNDELPATYVVDWGDGNWELQNGWAVGSNSFVVDHSYSSQGTYSVTMWIGTASENCATDSFGYSW